MQTDQQYQKMQTDRQYQKMQTDRQYQKMQTDRQYQMQCLFTATVSTLIFSDLCVLINFITNYEI